MKNYYLKSTKELYKIFNTSSQGLLEDEVKLRLDKYGKNKLNSNKKQSNFKKFISQLNNMMIIILFISALISGIISIINNESIIDSIIILIIVIINACMGFFQEIKADKSIEALKKLQTPFVKVRRNNKVKKVNIENIVVGDIILLEAGDYVPADARIIKAHTFKVDESSLTGEANVIDKDNVDLTNELNIGELTNMVFAGTIVIWGKAEAIVVETGSNTILGNIAKTLNNQVDLKTPLQIKIQEISKTISIIIAIIILIIFILNIIKGSNLKDTLLLSISLSVAAIPEGLPAIITIILSLSTNSLANKNAIVRKMTSIETLGCTQIICSDKTGTITQNKMKIMSVIYGNKIVNKINSKKFIEAMALCNDAIKDNEYIGDPTEIAIYQYLDANDINPMEIKNKYERINEIPFDSIRKLMSTIHNIDNKKIIFTKGSLDSIITKCKYIEKNNQINQLSLDDIKKIKDMEDAEADKALRVLAFAYKEITNDDVEAEKDLVFLGLVGMIDPPRNKVKESIKECIKAGITPIMITGDSLRTANAIAKNVGILKNDEEAIEGKELDKYSDEELKQIIPKYRVYARVSPEHKLCIVKAWQNNSKIVAMTGDGVNDAPAVKAANIGIGMGITGTEVTKNVADIILADDCFNTIVSAIKEGRRIYDNIKNVILYLLVGNIVEVLFVFIMMLNNYEVLSPIHLLYINLITDSIPAIALAFEKENDDIMEREARNIDKPFFTPFMIVRMITSAIFKTIGLFIIWYYSLNNYGCNIANTMVFLGLIIMEILFAISCKNIKHNVINKNIFNNKKLNASILILIIIQIIAFMTPIKKVLKITPIYFINFIEVLIPCLIVFIIIELTKYLITIFFKD